MAAAAEGYRYAPKSYAKDASDGVACRVACFFRIGVRGGPGSGIQGDAADRDRGNCVGVQHI